MYMYDFLKSLTMLQNENMPNINSIPNENIFYFGTYKKVDLKNYELKFPNDGENYLIYSHADNILDLKSICVDDYLNYINKLDMEAINFDSYNPEEFNTALTEAMLLLDAISSLEDASLLFDAQLTIPLTYLEDFFNSNIEEYIEIADKFKGIRLIKDIYFSQILYFIKKYVKAKLGNSDTQMLISNHKELEKLVKIKIQEITDDYTSLRKYQLQTIKTNDIFSGFIFQIELLADQQLEERRRKAPLE